MPLELPFLLPIVGTFFVGKKVFPMLGKFVGNIFDDQQKIRKALWNKHYIGMAINFLLVLIAYNFAK